MSISGQALSIAATEVVIDSGTSAILLGAEDAAAIHKVSHPLQPGLVLFFLAPTPEIQPSPE